MQVATGKDLFRVILHLNNGNNIPIKSMYVLAGMLLQS